MDVGAVEKTRPVERAEVVRGPGDVAPALGVAGANRMQDDSYTKRGQNQQRGMDEDAAEESADNSEATPKSGSGGGVNLFA